MGPRSSFTIAWQTLRAFDSNAGRRYLLAGGKPIQFVLYFGYPDDAIAIGLLNGWNGLGSAQIKGKHGTITFI